MTSVSLPASEAVARRRALITASASGIGSILSERAISHGYEVIISDRDIEKGEAQAARLGCRFIACDLSEETDIISLIKEAGPVHLLVNNGGISGPTAPVAAISTKEWRQVFDVNITAQFIACREMVPLMQAAEKGGCIINMSSVAAVIGYENRSPYAASKAAVLSLTAVLAREVGKDGIRVNSILPATTRGARIERVISDYATANGMTPQEGEAHYLARHADGRMIEPEEVADTILFLASDSGRAITGQSIRVDGGFQ